MDKKIVGLVGAISGLMSLSTAQATAVPPTETALPSAQSFGELLDPIPNAAALLRIADAAGRHTNPNVKLVHDTIITTIITTTITIMGTVGTGIRVAGGTTA
jgi:hypothetical protein